MLLFMSAFPTSYLEDTGHPALSYPILEKPFDFEALNLKLKQIMGDGRLRSCRSACGRLTSAVATFF